MQSALAIAGTKRSVADADETLAIDATDSIFGGDFSPEQQREAEEIYKRMRMGGDESIKSARNVDPNAHSSLLAIPLSSSPNDNNSKKQISFFVRIFLLTLPTSSPKVCGRSEDGTGIALQSKTKIPLAVPDGQRKYDHVDAEGRYTVLRQFTTVRIGILSNTKDAKKNPIPPVFEAGKVTKFSGVESEYSEYNGSQYQSLMCKSFETMDITQEQLFYVLRSKGFYRNVLTADDLPTEPNGQSYGPEMLLRIRHSPPTSVMAPDTDPLRQFGPVQNCVQEICCGTEQSDWIKVDDTGADPTYVRASLSIVNKHCPTGTSLATAIRESTDEDKKYATTIWRVDMQRGKQNDAVHPFKNIGIRSPKVFAELMPMMTCGIDMIALSSINYQSSQVMSANTGEKNFGFDVGFVLTKPRVLFSNMATACVRTGIQISPEVALKATLATKYGSKIPEARDAIPNDADAAATCLTDGCTKAEASKIIADDDYALYAVPTLPSNSDVTPFDIIRTLRGLSTEHVDLLFENKHFTISDIDDSVRPVLFALNPSMFHVFALPKKMLKITIPGFFKAALSEEISKEITVIGPPPPLVKAIRAPPAESAPNQTQSQTSTQTPALAAPAQSAPESPSAVKAATDMMGDFNDVEEESCPSPDVFGAL